MRDLILGVLVVTLFATGIVVVAPASTSDSQVAAARAQKNRCVTVNSIGCGTYGKAMWRGACSSGTYVGWQVSNGTWQECEIGRTLTYKGFSADMSAVPQNERNASATAIRRQIDIVEQSLRSGEITDDFKWYRIVVDPAVSARGGEYRSGRNVRIGPLPSHSKPLLLHEFMHAYHFNEIGRNDPEIANFYAAAVRSGKYPPPVNRQVARVIENDAEFFAVTASLFLFGSVDTDPYTRAALRQNDPDWYQYLVDLFGFDPEA